MDKLDANSRLAAFILIGLGALFLLGNLGWLGAFSQLFWSLAFVGGGAAFLSVFYNDRSKWWAIIPGFALLALGSAVLLDDLAGSAFLGLLGGGFLAVYLTGRQRWWAIIPAGVLLSLALVAGAEELVPRWDGGPLFFLGLAATFASLYLLPEHEGRQRWALYPAVGFLALVVLSSSVMGGIWRVLWPLALIGGGVYLIRRRQSTTTKTDLEESHNG